MTAEESDMHNPGNPTPERFPAQDRFADGAQFSSAPVRAGPGGAPR